MRECFNCRHYKPSAPDDWKPRYEGSGFGVGSLREYLAKDDLQPSRQVGWPGTCSFNPIPVDVRSIYLCSHYDVNDVMIYHWYQWVNRADLERENAKLREQLKAAKRLAAERYHKLKRGGKANAT